MWVLCLCNGNASIHFQAAQSLSSISISFQLCSATVFGNQFLSAVKQSVVFGVSHHLYCMANSSYNVLKSSPMKFLCADNVWDMTLWYATFMFNYYCLGKLRGILPEVAGRVGEDLAMLHSIERDLKFYFSQRTVNVYEAMCQFTVPWTLKIVVIQCFARL